MFLEQVHLFKMEFCMFLEQVHLFKMEFCMFLEQVHLFKMASPHLENAHISLIINEILRGYPTAHANKQKEVSSKPTSTKLFKNVYIKNI